jgi:hypothetical protein
MCTLQAQLDTLSALVIQLTSGCSSNDIIRRQLSAAAAAIPDDDMHEVSENLTNEN